MKKFVQIECGRKMVADGIGDAFKINTRHNSEIETDTDKWEPKQPVFISAQTGRGKNYFIEKTLLPYIRELNHKQRTDQKVLIISNRIALRLQIESRLNDAKVTLYIKRFNEEDMENRISSLIKQQDAYHSYNLAYDRAWDDSEKSGKYNYEAELLNKYYNNNFEDWKNAKYLFGRDRNRPTRVYPNLIARSLVEKVVSRYGAILEEMRRTDEGQKVTGQRYLEYQLSWFGKKYDEENGE